MRSRRFLFAPSRSRHQGWTSYGGGFRVHALCREWGTRSSRIAISGKICAFFATRAKFEKNANIGLCACLRTVITQSFARRCASRAEEIGFARGCSCVHFCTKVRVFVTSTLFCWFFSNYVEDYLKPRTNVNWLSLEDWTLRVQFTLNSAA